MSFTTEPSVAPRPTLLAPQLPLTLFDQVGCGMMICDEYGRLRFVNRMARQELASHRVIRLDGRALKQTPEAHGDLPTALRLAARRGRRSLVQLSRLGDQLMLTALPFEVPGGEPGLVLVVLGRRRACTDLDLELLGSVYGLTLAERRVLAALMGELTPSEIAERHAVKLSTVRTQISSIRSKVGARSVEGLLLKVAQVPSVAPVVQAACAVA